MPPTYITLRPLVDRYVGRRRRGVGAVDPSGATDPSPSVPAGVEPEAGRGRVARVAVLEDHPTIRAGIEAMLAAEPDLLLVGAAATEEELGPLLRSSDPAVLLLDVDHPGHRQLQLALRLSMAAKAPALVLYAARSDPELAAAAALVGARAVIAKTADRTDLTESLRRASRAGVLKVPPAVRRRAAEATDPADHPILAMRLAGSDVEEIAATLRIVPAAVAGALATMLARLAPSTERDDRRPVVLAG